MKYREGIKLIEYESRKHRFTPSSNVISAEFLSHTEINTAKMSILNAGLDFEFDWDSTLVTYFIQGRFVTAVVNFYEDMMTGELAGTACGTAKCNKEDEFDLEFGKNLALYRAFQR